MSIKTYLLDGEPVTASELRKEAENYFQRLPMDIVIDMLKWADHEVSEIPEEKQVAECPWPERLPK